jgi:hypothetical protein
VQANLVLWSKFAAAISVSFQNGKSVPEVLRQWRFEGHPFSRSWMCEGQSKGMQHLAWRSVVRQLLQTLILPIAVGPVTNQRKPKKLEMDANLMGSASVKNRFDESRPAQTFENMIRSSRGSPHVFVHCHAFPV